MSGQINCRIVSGAWKGILLAALLLLMPLAGLDACAGEPPPLGINLSGVVDWSSEIAFVDAFRPARAWISQAEGEPWGRGGEIDVDEAGHVKSLRPGQYAETIVYTGFERRFPAGRFTCLYEGEGELRFTGDARVVESVPGKMIVAVRPRDGQVTLQLRRTSSEDPVRNIRFILPGFEATYEEQPFHPDFLARWQEFRSIRFMDWAATNNSTIREWSDRPKLSDHSQALRGVAPELMIDLANELGVAPWFCLPLLASDDYVRQFARLVKERLDPKLAVYVEYSNECWNGQFEQARYCQREGRRLGLSDNDYEAQLRYYGQRSVEIFAIFENVFDGRERLVRVLAVQSANPWTGETVLAAASAKGQLQADAIAIAPYFGHRWGDPRRADETAAMKVDNLMTALEDDVRESSKQMQDYASLAKEHGLKLMAYEGGQHLVGHGGAENDERLTALFHAANRHPRMKELYLRNLSDWREAGGDLFCVFSSMGLYSKWGSWGVLEHTGQNPSEAPKFQAIQEFFGAKR